MITLERARAAVSERLGTSRRAVHSVFVGHAMRSLAERLGADMDLWEIVGLCHDLDYFETAEDRSRHGMLVADWLKDELPADALDAIRAHDHRTGFHADTVLAEALRLADALAIVDERIGRAHSGRLGAGCDASELRDLLAARPYLVEMIGGISEQLRLPLSALGDMCRTAPAQ